jgi:NodT family efflux transporter outer membrane factor (OMF) lipoprotein
MSRLPAWVALPVRSHVCVACVLATLVAGCSVAPVKPDAPMAQSFDGASASLDATVPVRSGWWREYRDPALNALVERSLTHNFSLASAVASVELARGNAQKAGAAQYPSLTLGGTFDRGNKQSSSTINHSQSLFVEASYEVDFWGLNADTSHSAALLARASEFDRDTVALTLTASVVDTYFQVQSLRHRLTLAQTISDDASHILQLLLAQQTAGVATELQVQQQRTALATFQAAGAVLQQQLDVTMHTLAVLVGAAPEQFSVRDAELVAIPVPAPRPDLPARLLETRPDIASREAQLRSANYSVAAARAAFLPNIILTADGGVSSTSLSGFLNNPFAAIATSLAAPLFD